MALHTLRIILEVTCLETPKVLAVFRSQPSSGNLFHYIDRRAHDGLFSRVFENFRIQASTRIRIRIRSKNFHSGDRFQKFPDTAVKYVGYVWTQAVFVKKILLFHKFPDTCGQGLRKKILLAKKALKQKNLPCSLRENIFLVRLGQKKSCME